MHRDGGDAFDRDTAHLIDALNSIDDFLQRFGDAGFHLLRGSSAQCGGYRNYRQIHIWQLIDAELLKGKPAQDDQQQVHHGREDRTADAEVSKPKAAALRGLHRCGPVRSE